MLQTTVNVPDTSLHITFIDVGQGDSTLIRLPVRTDQVKRAILIDCPVGKSPAVLNLLEYHQIQHLELVIVTHSDEDHCGGIPDVLVNFARIGTIGQVAYIPDSPNRTNQPGVNQVYRRFARQILDLEHSGELAWWKPNLDTRCIDNVIIKFLHPNERDSWLGLVEQDRNSVSQVVSVEYGSFRTLFAADITKKGWQAILDRYEAGDNIAQTKYNYLRSQIVKVPHHGGAWKDYPSMVEMFSLLQPEYIVISAGTNNRYGHPSRSIFDAVADLRTLKRVLCTEATQHCCGLVQNEIYPCASSVEFVISDNSVVVQPDIDSHVARIIKLLHPACSKWLRL